MIVTSSLSSTPKRSNFGQTFLRLSTIFWIALSASLIARLLALRVAVFDAMSSQKELLSLQGETTRLAEFSDRAFITGWLADLQPALLRGVAQDILLSVLIALIFGLIGKWPKWLSFALFGAFLAANVEHIKYNFGNIDLTMLGMAVDPTFVRGSLSPDVVKYLIVILAFILLTATLLRWSPLRHLAGYLAPLCIVFALVFGFQSYPEAPDWVQTNPLFPIEISDNLPEDLSLPDAVSIGWQSTPVMAPGRYNLLVIYLEGLSVASLERGNMQTLQQLGRDGIQFDNYISRQIITANGLYATLTGDTPSFLRRFVKWEGLTPQAAVLDQALPHVLAKAGYQTGYLQSANLDYMSKDSHLRMLGFDDVKGDSDWLDAHSRNGWGIDDLTLMENTLAYIDTLPEDRPWFTGVLTTGTHSPYNVPGIASPTRHEALYAADQAVAALVNGLRDRGALNNTVVVITSDEGREAVGGEGFLQDMALNRLPLIVLHPDLAGIKVPDYLMNTDLRDLALTLTNRLDVKTLTDSLPQHDDVVFGNFITGKVFWYDTIEDTLTGCKLGKFSCLTWAKQTTLFGPTQTMQTAHSMPAFADLIEVHDRAPVVAQP